jgi:hypothetical protein
VLAVGPEPVSAAWIAPRWCSIIIVRNIELGPDAARLLELLHLRGAVREQARSSPPVCYCAPR